MGLEINTIITLEDNKKYLVLNETIYEGKKYFLTASITEDNKNSNEEVAVFQEELEGLDIYVRKVIDQNLMLKLKDLLKNQM